MRLTPPMCPPESRTQRSSAPTKLLAVQDVGGFVGAVGGFAGGERALKEFIETGAVQKGAWQAHAKACAHRPRIAQCGQLWRASSCSWFDAVLNQHPSTDLVFKRVSGTGEPATVRMPILKGSQAASSGGACASI
eukprot:221236-Pelagomonas_calceolata.AAC.1